MFRWWWVFDFFHYCCPDHNYNNNNIAPPPRRHRGPVHCDESLLVPPSLLVFDHARVSDSSDTRIPAIISRKENVKVDLLEARNLSGTITQGHPDGHGWVESYAGTIISLLLCSAAAYNVFIILVRYSSDGETWFTVLNDDGSQRVLERRR